MRLPPSKAEIRQQLEAQMSAYLAQGGEVTDVPRGISGREDTKAAIGQNSFVQNNTVKPAPEDTRPLNDVVQSIEARRRPKAAKPASKNYVPKPKRKLIYDDFGEPLRWEWVNE